MTIGSVTTHYETQYEIEVDWRIEDFLSYLVDFEYTKRSPIFNWSSINWFFKIDYDIYGENEIQLFLKQIGGTIEVKFQLGLKLRDGTTEMRCAFRKKFHDDTTGFGTDEFIVKSELIDRKHELLPAGVLTITCSITHQDNLQNIKYENLDLLSLNLKNLYGCTESSDMIIIVGNREYPVHTAILAARSDVFAAMFKHDMEERKSGITKIPDCDPTAFKDFLLYLYTGKVENLSSDNVGKLYKMADKYNVQDLKILCIRFMKRNILMTNWLEIVAFANQYDEKELNLYIQDFFDKNVADIASGDDWKKVLRDNFEMVYPFLNKTLKMKK